MTQLTSVVQPPGYANAYPFSAPSADVRGLFTDLYLVYDDDLSEFKLPFSLFWVAGFGSHATSPPFVGFTQVHTYDVVIEDADGATVFDSTAASSMYTLAWGSRTIVEWIKATAVCRVVTDINPPDWPIVIVPAVGGLDSRTYERMPRRVRSVKIGSDVFTSAFDVVGGYNVALTPTQTVPADGSRASTQITLDATPGGGLGQFPGCSTASPAILRINNVRPDAAGNFILDATDCLRLQAPVTIGEDMGNRIAHYGSPELMSIDYGHALQLASDCPPCCQANYYVRTYKGLKKVWDAWQAAATRAKAVTDQHQGNIDRFDAAVAYQGDNPGELVVVPNKLCLLGIMGAYSNNAGNARRQHPVEIRFTHQLYKDGVLVAPSLVTAEPGGAAISGADVPGGTGAYIMEGHYPIFKAHVGSISSGARASVQYYLHVENCTAKQSLKITMTVHTPNGQAGCTLPTATVPSDIGAIWAAAGDVPAWPARCVVSRGGPLTPATQLD